MVPMADGVATGGHARHGRGVLVAVHGGVDMEPSPATFSALRAAAAAGHRSYAITVDALDAAVDALGVLEDDPAFNAGLGSVLTREATVETDGAVADGSNRRFAGIAAAPGVRHPAAAARHLLREGGTALLVGESAARYAAECAVPTEDLVTHEQVLALAEGTASGRSVFTGRVPAPSETIGCLVAQDDGSVFAASSTGGLRGKRTGRVGDAAIPGAGYWADARVAVLCSGDGEASLVFNVARRVAERAVEHGVAASAVWGVGEVARESGAVLAIVAVDGRTGAVAAAHNGASFPVVVSRDGVLEVVQPELVPPSAGVTG